MSSSYSTEYALEEMAEALLRESTALRAAAEVLRRRREEAEKDRTAMKELKDRVQDWLKR